MTSQEGCITVTWKIRNFSVLLKAKECQHLKSPNLEFEDTKGRVVRGRLYSYRIDSQICFFVRGFSDSDHRVRNEMFFISTYGDVLLKGDHSRTRFYFPKWSLFDKISQPILLNDTLTLCCKMWGKAIKTSERHISTVLHSLNHLWTIEKLAASNYHDTYFESENVKLRISLQKDVHVGCMVIAELEPHAPDDLFFVDCSLSVKDNCERVLNYKRTSFSSKKYLYNIKRSSNITGVILQLEFIVALRDRLELPASSQVVRETPLKPYSPTNTAQHKNVSGALGDDLLLLYRESALSDATLNTAGKSFSAHRTVLAARSPVFRAMFETSEDQSGVVDIDDVDSETVERMLVYLYSDSVGDLTWKEASALYYAAAKYEILLLKEKCEDFLKARLPTDKACDVLVLADRHSDQELMTRIMDFILCHEEVVSSAQWEELEKDNPMLCAKVVK